MGPQSCELFALGEGWVRWPGRGREGGEGPTDATVGGDAQELSQGVHVLPGEVQQEP